MTEGQSVSRVDKYIVDAQLIGSLGEIKGAKIPLRTALALLNIDGRACDDVILMAPWYFDS